MLEVLNDKGLISKIYSEFLQINLKNAKQENGQRTGTSN